jgi:excisionase family DNA binding protein
MSEKKKSRSAGHARDGKLPLSRVANTDQHAIAHTPDQTSDRPTPLSTGAKLRPGKRTAQTEPPSLPSPQQRRHSFRENKPRHLLSIRDVAEILNRSDKSVRRDISSGELRAIRIGGSWRIDPADLQDFIHERRSP